MTVDLHAIRAVPRRSGPRPAIHRLAGRRAQRQLPVGRHYVDPSRIALSFQFFNKTYANIRANPCAQLLVVEPGSGRQFLLDIIFERAEAEGPTFEEVKDKLDAVATQNRYDRDVQAAHADIHRVVRLTQIPPDDGDEEASATIADPGVADLGFQSGALKGFARDCTRRSTTTGLAGGVRQA